MRFVFRADASRETGFGHIVRSSVLASELERRGHEVIFLSADPDEKVKSFFDVRNLELKPLPKQSSDKGAAFHLHAMKNFGAEITILDSYLIDNAYRAKLNKGGARIAVFDDVCEHFSHSELVLNHNPSANKQGYGDYKGKLLIGPEYAIIDKRFAEMEKGNAPQKTPRLLVTLGGTDSADQTKRILGLLDRLEDDFRISLLGGFYSDSILPEGMKHELEILERCDDMPSLIAECDCALTAGGVTCMELACVGLPFIIVLTDIRQFENARKYHYSGAALYAGRVWKKTDGEYLKAFGEFFKQRPKWNLMGYAGRKLIDGKGAHRAAEEIEKYFSTNQP